MSLVDTIKNIITPGMTVLDVGSGDFEYALALQELGCHVTALDIQQPESIPSGITFIQGDIVSHEPTTTYDVIFMSFVVNFLDKKMLTEIILPRYKNAKVIAIRTFSAPPEPFDDRKKITTYTTDDFQNLPWKQTVLKTWDEIYPSSDGVERLWHLLDYVGVSHSME
ncbi:MAG: class I SAM-dependent methyltransferase [Patescibacteria group bacterium]